MTTVKLQDVSTLRLRGPKELSGEETVAVSEVRSAAIHSFACLIIFAEGTLSLISLSEEGLVEARNLENELKDCRGNLEVVRSWADSGVIEAEGDLQQQQERIDKQRNVIDERKREILKLSDKLNEREEKQAKDKEDAKKLEKLIAEVEEKKKKDVVKSGTRSIVSGIGALGALALTGPASIPIAATFLGAQIFFGGKMVKDAADAKTLAEHIKVQIKDCEKAICDAKEEISRMSSDLRSLDQTLSELKATSNQMEIAANEMKICRDAIIRCSELLLEMISLLTQLIPHAENTHRIVESFCDEGTHNQLVVENITRKFELAKTEFRKAVYKVWQSRLFTNEEDQKLKALLSGPLNVPIADIFLAALMYLLVLHDLFCPFFSPLLFFL